VISGRKEVSIQIRLKTTKPYTVKKAHCLGVRDYAILLVHFPEEARQPWVTLLCNTETGEYLSEMRRFSQEAAETDFIERMENHQEISGEQKTTPS
jgi:hypothetical protein